MRLEKMEPCPFKVGEVVRYTPTRRGRHLGVMTDLAALKPDEKYRIAKIHKDAYVVLEGFEYSPAGGLYWTEFKRDE
jgi:hypothetical protein